MDAVKLTDRQIQPVPTPSVPRAAGSLRVSIVSDAITGRNGVGTYYPDLLQHLRPFVDAIELVAPDEDCQADLERFSLPMPGDKTQRLAWPRKPLLYQHLDEFAPNVVVIPSLGAYSYYAMRYAQSRNIPFAIVNHTNFDHLLSLYWPNWLASPFRQGLRKLNRWLCREASAVAAMNVDAFQEANARFFHFIFCFSVAVYFSVFLPSTAVQ